MAEYTIDKIEYGDNVYKLQDNVSGYVSGGNVIPYLTCGTAAGTAAKTTTLVTGTLPATLTTGTRVAVKFSKSNTVANPTIAIGSYGAIAIKRYGTTAPSTTAATSWSEGNVITLVYDGTNWLMSDWTLSSASHTHGNITSGGDITATAPTIASGDQIIINDNSASKITNGPTFDGSTTTTALTPKGTWETFSKFRGSYNDLTDKPTIPTVPSNIVNTITTTAGTHTAITNQTGSVSFNVPTKTSHLTNDSGFITNAGVTSITTTAGAHTTKTSATGAVSFNVPTKTSHLTNDSGFITNAGVTSITTTAGTHTTISSSTGAVSFNVPTKTSHLTNDSGFITSYTDEKLKWTASTSTNTYYPLVSTSTATTSTANTLNGINFYQYYNTAGGYRRLELGNATANQSTGGAYGMIRLFGANATYYGDLVPGNPELGSDISGAGLSGNRTWKIPDKSGTIALTSDLSNYVQKPSQNGTDGWILKTRGNNNTYWDAPNVYQFGIYQDANNPGTYGYYGGDIEDYIRDAFASGLNLALHLDLLNSINELDTYMLTDYHAEWISTDAGAYIVLWFTGTFKTTNLIPKKITVGIYLDELEIEHEYGEITVDVREVGERYTINGGDTGYTTNINTTADQFKQLAVLNLPAGRWIVTARARFAPTSSSNHYSAINIGTTTAGSGSTTTGNAIRDRRYGEGTYFNQHTLTRILSLATDGPVYLNGGGSNVAGTWTRTNDVFQFDAIRIS